MSPWLNGRRAFWAAMGAGAVVLALLIVFWAFPAYIKLRLAREEWRGQIDELRMLRTAAPNIPSLESIQKRQDYRTWLADQADIAKRFFADRTAIIEVPLAAEGQASPAEFKEAYHQATNTQRKWLEENRRSMTLSNMPEAYSSYPWMIGAALPDRATYLDVLHDYWTRYYLYKMLLRSGVSVVKTLEVRKAVSTNALFDGISFHLDVTLPPDKVNGLVEYLLSVSATDSSKPVLDLVRISMQPEILNGRAMLGVQLDGRVLLLKKNLRSGEGPSS
jgi:hypothetical protein